LVKLVAKSARKAFIPATRKTKLEASGKEAGELFGVGLDDQSAVFGSSELLLASEPISSDQHQGGRPHARILRLLDEWHHDQKVQISRRFFLVEVSNSSAMNCNSHTTPSLGHTDLLQRCIIDN